MAQHFTRASPYLQLTAKQLASRDTKGWSYPLWGYVLGCIGVACVCLFNGFITALLQKRERRMIAEKGDLENGVVVGVPIDGTSPDSMAKEPHMMSESYAPVPSTSKRLVVTKETDADTTTLATLESQKNASLPTKMKRVFQKFGKGKNHDYAASVTVVNTSATNTTARNSVGSQARGDWKGDSKAPSVYKADEEHGDHIDHIAVSRPHGDADTIARV